LKTIILSGNTSGTGLGTPWRALIQTQARRLCYIWIPAFYLPRDGANRIQIQGIRADILLVGPDNGSIDGLHPAKIGGVFQLAKYAEIQQWATIVDTHLTAGEGNLQAVVRQRFHFQHSRIHILTISESIISDSGNQSRISGLDGTIKINPRRPRRGQIRIAAGESPRGMRSVASLFCRDPEGVERRILISDCRDLFDPCGVGDGR